MRFTAGTPSVAEGTLRRFKSLCDTSRVSLRSCGEAGHLFHFSLLRFLCLLFLLLPPFTFCLLPSPVAEAGGDTPVSTQRREGRLVVFDDVWKTIRDRYYDESFNGMDWDAARDRFRAEAAEAASSQEFYSVLRRMVGGLRDSHTRVYAPYEKFDWQHPRVITTGIYVREVSGEAVVTGIERGSEAERAGLRAGDVITSVDGEPALALFMKRLRDVTGASTAQSARARAMSALLAGAADSTVRVGWLGGDGQERFATFRRQWRDRTAGLVIEKARDRLFIARFDSFTGKVALDFMRALHRRLQGARGLVIDLRNNGGGDSEAMTDVISAFLSPRTGLGRFVDRTGKVVIEPQTRTVMLLAAESIARFNGQVVILTSERTASAAEIFVASIREARRAAVIGTGTCGCVLAIRRRHLLPDGGELDVSEMDYRTRLGLRLEGSGVAPDEIIMPDLRDIRAGRDRAIERAIELLSLSAETQSQKR
ncbi:MAG TPA: S41 family peptidase [Pyrinomonadaceae bacterium]|jgi:carboxyl-terminal processing protease